MPQDLLKNIYLFRGMPAEWLQVINEAARFEKLNRGDIVFNQGDPATALYVIKYGSARITHKRNDGDGIEVAVLGTGSHFGEMAFVDRDKRSATVEIMETSEIIVLDYDKFEEVLNRNPPIAVHMYRALCQCLCGRLRMTTNDLSFAREMKLKRF